MTISLGLEKFYQMGGNKILSFGDVVNLTKNGVDYIGHDNLKEVMKYVTAEQAVNIQKFLDATEEKKRKEVTKEVFEEEFNEAISLDETLIKAGKVSMKTILDLAKEGIEVLGKNNLKKAIEVVGEENLKELIGENKSRYTVYRKGGKIYSIKKEFSLILGVVEWEKIVIAEADKVKMEKFGLEDINEVEYLGKITGKSDAMKKEWKVDFMVEEDGHVSFFNCKFDIKKDKNRAMVRRLRKEVNELQLKLVELQTEEELQAEEKSLQ